MSRAQIITEKRESENFFFTLLFQLLFSSRSNRLVIVAFRPVSIFYLRHGGDCRVSPLGVAVPQTTNFLLLGMLSSLRYDVIICEKPPLRVVYVGACVCDVTI